MYSYLASPSTFLLLNGSFHGIPDPVTSTSSNETLLPPEKRTFSCRAMYSSSLALVSLNSRAVLASPTLSSRVTASTSSILSVASTNCSSRALTLTPRTASSIANSAFTASIRAMDSATFVSSVAWSIEPSLSIMCFSMIFSIIGVAAICCSASADSSAA